MNKPGLTLTRVPYEEPHHLNLVIEATNGRTAGRLEYHCNAVDLSDLGKKLADFSGKLGEPVVYELGSEDPAVRFGFFLRICFQAHSALGQSSMPVRMNNNCEARDREMCEFGIKAEVADINHLGQLLLAFGRLEHRILEWRIQEGCLHTA